MSPDMAATVAALFFAHVLADYVFQTRWIVQTKRGVGFAVHIAIVCGTAMLSLGQISAAVMVLTALHLIIDALKTAAFPDRLWSYTADQALHTASIVAVAAWRPGAWEAGFWAQTLAAWIPAAMALLAGWIFATRAGQFAVEMTLVEAGAAEQQLVGRSAMLGHVERSIVYVAILAGYVWFALTALAAMAIRARALLGITALEDRRRALIGTGASIAWAAVTGVMMLALLRAL